MTERVDFIVSLVSGPKILDLGCVHHSMINVAKNNWLHRKLCNKFPFVVGVDILEKEISILKEQGYNVVCSDVENLNLNEKFNTIVAGELIEHLSNVGNFFTSCKKHLLPNGKLILSSPNPFCIQMFMAGIFFRNKEWGNKEHVIWLDVNTARNMGSRFGFMLKEYYFVYEKINTKKFTFYNKLFANTLLPFIKPLCNNATVYVFQLQS